MLYHDRIDVSEGTGINEGSASRVPLLLFFR